MLIFLAVGCSSADTPREREREQEQRDRDSAWKSVRVTANPDQVKGCKSLGNVRGEATNILGSGSENVEKSMRKQAADMGGDAIFIISTETHRYSEGSAEVYACPAEPDPTPTPTAAPEK